MSEEAKARGGPVVLRDRYTVFPDQPLPQLSTPSADAFHAEMRGGGRNVFALITRPGFPPRLNPMRVLKGLDYPGVMNLVEWGPIDWPLAGRRCMAVVYERPLGPRVMADMKTNFRRIDEYEAVRRAINPLSLAVKEIHQKGVVHRAIRPTNMFWTSDAREGIVLGDCASAPPGLDQPSVFEPIERAMCHPAGRGIGSYSEDLYALGVSLAMILTGRNPVAHLDDATLINRKIAHGTYSTLVGEERLPIATIEVLRGLLCDDPHERWNMEALELWLNGRRLSPLQPKLDKRAQRGFPYNGKEYTTARELGIGMAAGWEQAMPVIGNGKLELWLARATEDKARSEAVTQAVRWIMATMGEKKGGPDVLTARVCMILDPMAPIRYKNVAVMPDGIGPLLAVLYAEGKEVRTICELIMRDVPKQWFETRPEYNPDNSVIDGLMKDAKSYLEQTGMGQGLERTLYHLNETLPCLSPLLGGEYVVDIRELLPALEAAAGNADQKNWPIDRHVAAFIAARAPFDVSRQLVDLTNPDPARSTAGMLNMLAVLQWRVGPDSTPNLAAWLGNLVGPIIGSYNNRETRRHIEHEIPRIVRAGSLIELSRLVDSPEERNKDRHGFEWARVEYQQATAEIEELENNVEARELAALQAGHQTASLGSVGIAFATVLILVIMRLF